MNGKELNERFEFRNIRPHEAGQAADEHVFRDAFFTDAGLHDPEGENIMLLGLDVLPEYRRQGLASEIMRQYQCREARQEEADPDLPGIKGGDV